MGFLSGPICKPRFGQPGSRGSKQKMCVYQTCWVLSCESLYRDMYIYIYIHTHSKKWDKTMTSGLNDLRTHLILSLILAPAMGDPSDPILQAHQWAHCAVAHVIGTHEHPAIYGDRD